MELAYPVARSAAPQILRHLSEHLSGVIVGPGEPSPTPTPDVKTIEQVVEAAFWASLRREEGYVPKISLAFLPPTHDLQPMMFAQALPLDPATLTKLAPAVERPSIHLGVWRTSGELFVWGTTGMIPPYCLVVEVVAPGLLVIKHRPRSQSRKFVNIAVLEADRMKIVDEKASTLPDCPGLLTSLLGFDSSESRGESLNILVQIAVSMRKHGRGGALLVVPSQSETWLSSVVQPIAYAVDPPYTGLATLVDGDPTASVHIDWVDAVARAVDALAGLTAVDGATVITDKYELLAFGVKIRRRRGAEPVEQVMVTEPIEESTAEVTEPGRLGGTRHLSAVQFIQDQPDAVALVASQDGHFTIFAWSPCEQMVHAHRVEALLL